MKRLHHLLLPGICLAVVFISNTAMAISTPFKDSAKALAGEDMLPLYQNFCRAMPNKAELTNTPIEPQYIFDNLVFLGRAKWNSWALLTDDGIVIFDAMETEQEAQTFIVEGLQSLGLAPSTIRAVVIMHGHGDHFGGARLLQSRYGAKVYASAADWQLMAITRAISEGKRKDREFDIINGIRIRYLIPGQTVPEYDQIIEDGSVIAFGNTQITFYLTPGHTPGTVSAIIPVRDGNTSHTAAFWGGTGYSAPGTPLNQYQESLLKFKNIARESQADVAISNHVLSDMTLYRLPALKHRQEGLHPFVIGPSGYQRVLGILSQCIQAYQEKEIE